MKKIGSPIQENETYLKRDDYQKELLRKLEALRNKIKLGGGQKAIEKHKAKGKLTARERIARLIDDEKSFFELGLFSAHGMYEEYGGAPSSGTIYGIGKINGKNHVIVANDATVKAGAWFPITAKKNLRAQEIAIENKLPIIYLVDSAGVFLPLQDEIFPDKEHFGRIFRNNAVISSMGIPQIAAIMGPCVAGGAYLPIMSDEALIVEGEGSVFLAGAHLVKAAIGEVIDNESLGGAKVQSNISGVTDYIMKNDEECLDQIRSLTGKFGDRATAGFNREKSKPPIYSPKEIYGLLPEDTIKPYDMYEVIARIVDESSIDEYKAGYGKTVITCYARIDGWAVGIIANQRSVVKTEMHEMQVGGVIYSDSADKAARFIMNCNQRKIPLVFLQDVTGFMVGSRAEQGGIIKDGAKMVNAVANSVVPKITIIVGNSFGAGNYAMCGKAYDPRFIFAYPNAKIAVMGSSQASSVLLDIKLKQVEKEGKRFSDDDRKKLLDEIIKSYEEKNNPMYAAARLWIDEIIDPALTRDYISICIEVANNNPDMPKFNPGVIQT
ncbi:MAG: methylcrotonoyl-CoA carboxylase [Ignavibacteria bacterium RIFOXYB2_FULL_35_12]|nr:MAG: methylcrotonoyl-CoA carboxylase [Ignavibacteria bacterium GWA2_36_19]OGU49021.1 MAG: methylcrotonoyl-CoA carboxylase [Ignavibacteria bacterium GWC2_35_8]OGU59748.1 MAG: methylcrotonoyl-CoA carboxylase [Ignavibacteria bacterium GWF2_35_20]OGU85216.1 MAG: methylcrotonoyl-CoA carboxylase [Ignavibacteria bacterium RIFOXYA12_FULL_35_25]OGU91773.1 MAG: methylcrotonoyl-CoA carboxylase [Ignavibacteria bacterium RIFOXYC12_FULL_35_11]OGU97431.1 MAG: methylcrotonoyl-CoA carboxylase [Ignavibacteri